MAKKEVEKGAVEIAQVEQGSFSCCIIGKTPLILNRMSVKASHELLLPRKKTAADKASTLKHNPPEEYRASCYTAQDDKAKTRLLIMATAFKGAMRSAAIDLPGAAKSVIGRLTYVEGEYLPIFGTPKLFMSITRSADMNRTPDVRTRAIVPEWATMLKVTYIKPLLREKDVLNLLASAGVMRGVGDWRVEKGSGTYGQFEICAQTDPRYVALLKQGRQVQDAALEFPEPYDSETAEMLTWYTDEAERRGFSARTGTVARQQEATA